MSETKPNNSVSEFSEEYSETKEALGFFDANLWWDPSLKACLRPQPDFDAFYKSLGALSVKKGILSLAECLKYDENTGNKRLKKIMAGCKNLYGAMTLTADAFFLGRDITKTVDEMVEARAVIVRMFPRTHRYSFDKNALCELFSHLNRRRIPLMLWHAEVSWGVVESLFAEFPDMPVIIEGNDVKLLYHNRYYIPLYQKYKNMYLETHNLIIYKELDFLVKADPDRLIFGSFYHYNAPDTAMAPIILADWDLEVKKQIAHGNLERLISGIG